MSIGLLLAIVVSIGAGVLCVVPLWRRGESRMAQTTMLAALAVTLGTGLLTCVDFMSLLLFGVGRGRVLVSGIVLVVFLAGVQVVRGRHTRAPEAGAGGRRGVGHGLSSLLAVSLLAAGSCAAVSFAIVSLRAPHGAWDAWAIWNLRARFLFQADADWAATFSQVMPSTHPDYPLLLPLAVVRVWSFLGEAAPSGPVVVAAIFTIATVALVCSSLAILRTTSQALLAGLLLLALPSFARHGTTQYADVPVGFFFVACLSLLCMTDRIGADERTPLVLAGLAIGLAAWTKNEGLLLVVTIAGARCAAVISSRGRMAWLREVPAFAVGLAPVLGIVLTFKLLVAPPNDLVSGQGLHATLERLVNWDRYVEVFRGLWNAAIGLMATAFWNPVWVFVVYLACVGVDAAEVRRPGFVTVVLAIGLTLAGYVLVYLVTPRDLSWHLRYSADRLLLQLWPAAVFLGFLIARTPEDCVS